MEAPPAISLSRTTENEAPGGGWGRVVQREEMVFNWDWGRRDAPQPDPVELQNKEELYFEVRRQHEQLVRNEFRFDVAENKIGKLKTAQWHF